MFKCDRATEASARPVYLSYRFVDEFDINSISVWYGYFVFTFCCYFPSIDAIAFNEQSTTMGVVQWVRWLRMQFAFYCVYTLHFV